MTTVTQEDREALAKQVRQSAENAAAEKHDPRPIAFTAKLMDMLATATVGASLMTLHRAKLHADAELRVLRDEVHDLRRLLAESEARSQTFQRQLDRHRDHLKNLQDAMSNLKARV